MRIGIVGYGVGGKFFHAPFILAAEGVDLVGVVARSDRKKAEVAADLPGVPVYDSLTDLLAAGVDAVTITTPPQTRRELVLEAVAAGVHVIADKPFAPDADGGRELAQAAEDAGVILNVFHNRRFDADVLTLARLIGSGRLGDIWRVHSRFDLDEPGSLEGGATGGLLRDLGSHLIDQMIWLLGPVARVTAHLDWVGSGDERTDASFFVTLEHTSGTLSTVSASKLNRLQQREFLVYGSEGSYHADGTDVQAQAIFAGLRPADDRAGWGYEAEERWGVLSTAAGRERVASEQGDHTLLYERFAAAVRGDGPEPVPARGAIHTLEVLDAARTSALEGRTVVLAP